MGPYEHACGYREALDAMRDLVLIKGSESRLLWANHAFRDYYDMSEDELRDLVDGPQSDPDDTLQYVKDDRAVFASGEHLSIPSEQVTDASGASASFHTIKSPISECGQVVRSVGVSRRNADTEISTRMLSHDDAKSLARPLRLLASSFPLAIVLVDVGGRVVATSPQWRQTFASTALSLDDHLLRSLPELAALEGPLSAALTEGQSDLLQLGLDGEDGTRVYDMRIGPWHYDDGSIGGALILAIDVTEEADRQAELEIANERYGLVLGGASVGIWDRPDINADEEYWSDRYYELLGYEPGEIPASASMFVEMLHPDDRDRLEQDSIDHDAGGVAADLEFRLQRKTGEYRWYRGSGKASRDRDGRPGRMVGSIQDIDARKRAEEDVRRVNEDLEHFVHVAAHDLREPARRQILLVDRMLEQYGESQDDEFRRQLEQIQDQGNKMLSMVTGFRSLTGIAGPTLDVETVDLRRLVELLVAELIGSTPDGGGDAEVCIDLGADVQGYPVLLEVLYRNLIINATRHGRKPLHLEIGELADDGKRVFSVANHHAAGSSGDDEQLFMPFVRDDPSSDGSGLGLSICRRVVERHRGEIWIEPSDHTFTVHFTLGDQP